MIRDIFYGDIRRSHVDEDQYIDYYVLARGNTLEIGTPDMSFTGNPKKLDVLYYKAVNRYGEIASTVVYISNVKDSDDTSPIVYNPKYMLNSTNLEKNMEIVQIRDLPSLNWRNTKIQDAKFDALRMNSRYSVNLYEHFDRNTVNAAKVDYDEYRFDGWYELASVAPKEHDVHARNGVLRYDSHSDTIQYYTGRFGGAWEYVGGRVADTVGIYNFPTFTNPHQPYVIIPFFSIKETNYVYQTIVNKELDKEWFTRIHTMKPKITALYSFAKSKDFPEMQFIIQSMDLTLVKI